MSDVERDPTDTPFTVDWLRKLLADRKVLRKTQTQLSTEVLTELVKSLTAIRVYSKAYQLHKAADAAKLPARRAAELLVQQIPLFIKGLNHDISNKAYTKEMHKDLLQETLLLQEIQDKLLLMLNHTISLVQPSKVFPPAEAIDIYEELAGSFLEQMRQVHPDAVPSPASNDGVVARYVAAVVPYITGQTPKVPAVGQELKRLMRAKKKRAAQGAQGRAGD